jgi:hypothetical protein
MKEGRRYRLSDVAVGPDEEHFYIKIDCLPFHLYCESELWHNKKMRWRSWSMAGVSVVSDKTRQKVRSLCEQLDILGGTADLPPKKLAKMLLRGS